jgi:hypothetical protein
MSETVGHVGKLIPMYPNLDADLDTKIRWAVAELGIEVDDDDLMEVVYDSNSQLTVINNELYRMLDIKFDPGEYVKVTRNRDGSIDYIAIWYNGGASFEEVIESELGDEE